MQYVYLAKYNKALIKSAVKNFWLRYMGKDAVFSLIFFLLAVSLFFGIKTKSWMTGTFLSVSIIYIIILTASYFIYKKRSLSAFDQMGSESAEWRLSDLSFSVTAGIGKVEYKWSAIKKLWKFQDVWLLFYANSAYSTLPVENMPEDIKQFIQKNIEAHGGTIV